MTGYEVDFYRQMGRAAEAIVHIVPKALDLAERAVVAIEKNAEATHNLNTNIEHLIEYGTHPVWRTH